MKLINRSGFAVLPRQPFADWTQSLPQDEMHETLSLEEQRQEGTVYLIDEVESEDDFARALGQHWQKIFENELSAWDEFGDHWPAELSSQLFDQWFELRPQVMTLDLSSQPLMTASLEGLED